MAAARHTGIQGYVSKGFEGVRATFIENFARRKELGAACCVYVQGEKVVDLWGGIRNKATGEPWGEDTRGGRLLWFRRSRSWNWIRLCHQSYGHGITI
jgi:Beta-lactamase